MSSQVTLKANGLNTSPNNISLPPGSLLVANDVVIRRDNTIETRRGFKQYSEGFGSSIDRSKQLIQYKDTILVNYANKLAFDTTLLDVNGNSIFDTFAGNYSDAQTGLRMKSIEANKNLYFTTGEGIKKISARTPADFTTDAGFIKDAGAVQALDFTATLDITQGQTSGFLPADTAVAYRVLWGYKDLNDNLILGVPSGSIFVYNFLSNQIAMDLNGLTLVLDTINQSTSMINDGNYATSYYNEIGVLGSTLLNDVLQLAIQLDTNIFYASVGGSTPLTMSTIDVTNNIATITFDAGQLPENYFSVGDHLNLQGFGTIFDVVNAIQTVDTVDNTTRTVKFIVTSPDIASAAVVSGATIYSYNYQNITSTGDDIYSTPLNTLTLSTPVTSEQLRIINNNVSRILERLKVELPGVISTPLQTAYVTPFILTEFANVDLTITIPTNIDSSYFLQVYRSRNFTADGVQTLGNNGGVPVIPDDELRLVYEAFPTSAEISAGVLKFIDTSPETLIENNTNLYTNPETGDGILQANYQPPFALDINTFKNVTFYANTRTKFQIPILQLLGVSNINSGDTITISDGINTDTYTFVSGLQEITDITFNMTGLVASDYFKIYSANNEKIYNLYYIVDGVGTGPAISGQIDVPVNVLSTFSNNDLAIRTMDVINVLLYDFTAMEETLPTIRVTNISEGKCTAISPGTTPFVMTVVQTGDGEDAASKQVLLSSLVSAAQAIDETARSFVRVINQQSDSAVNAYYISGDNSPPGQINLQSKTLSSPIFYIQTSSVAAGTSFNPRIDPENLNINSISVANPTVVTTSSAHGLFNGDQVMISGSNSTPSIDGLYTVTVLSATSFTIPVNVTVAGTTAAWTNAVNIEYAANEVSKNRVYYSKVNQPDAVPLLNYIDVAAADRNILRIFPLRDSFFVFKEDGLYRISGELAPFVLALFDTSCVLIAPDSLGISNNEIYVWTLKGIVKVNETGASNNISRPIDNVILQLASDSYPNFGTITWGTGYNSDSTYTVYTNATPEDTSATVGFTFNNLTNTWTNVIRNETCGLVLRKDDHLYLGSGEFNYIERERKDFLRTDYADVQFDLQIGGGALSNNNTTIKLTSITNIDIGDVVYQDQQLTIYTYNKLLEQLDSDPTILSKNYLSTLQSIPGDDLRTKIVQLAAKLDTEGNLFTDYSNRIGTKTGTILGNTKGNPTVITTSAPTDLIDGRVISITGTQSPASIPALSGNYIVSNTGTFGTTTTFQIPVNVNTGGGTGLSYSTASSQETFQDIMACFNEIVSRLNADPGATFDTYQPVTEDTPMEAVILDINVNTKRITLNIPLQWIIGPITIFKSIPFKIVYAPETMGDPLMDKQIREATVMLDSKAITNFTVSFASDLIPEFFDIKFNGFGNGIFGSYAPPGFGYGFFGGIGGGAPFRTLIPPKIQRCRYILVEVDHNIAREKFILNGVTLTGEVSKSTRAYR